MSLGIIAHTEPLSKSARKQLKAEMDYNRALEKVATASRELVADVRSRYPGEALRCRHLIALDDALSALDKIS